MPVPDVIETRLSNGLQVLLKEVHSAPVVSTWIWYRVGSRNEVEGRTGLSHWVEHMLFKGSSRFPKGAIMRAVNRHGGYLNAMTSYDFTAYYETLPAAQAELALQIEADRMTTSLFDPQEVEAERTVIIAEREGSENEPHDVLAEELAAVAFRVHPYHHQPLGWKGDLRAITRDQLYAHLASQTRSPVHRARLHRGLRHCRGADAARFADDHCRSRRRDALAILRGSFPADRDWGAFRWIGRLHDLPLGHDR